MTQYRTRPEWADPPRVLTNAPDKQPTMDNFSFDLTADVLTVEPRLVGLALLVERCAKGAPMDADAWLAVDAIAETLVGPVRSVAQTTPVNAVSRAVSGDLRGAVIYRRYCAALRHLAVSAMTDTP